jgi:hypothetical protein
VARAALLTAGQARAGHPSRRDSPPRKGVDLPGPTVSFGATRSGQRISLQGRPVELASFKTGRSSLAEPNDRCPGAQSPPGPGHKRAPANGCFRASAQGEHETQQRCCAPAQGRQHRSTSIRPLSGPSNGRDSAEISLAAAERGSLFEPGTSAGLALRFRLPFALTPLPLVPGQRSRGGMALYRHLNEINRVFVLAFGPKAARHGPRPHHFDTLSSPGAPFMSRCVDDVEIMISKVSTYGAALKR